jgi:hypothetical protein
MKKLTKKQKNEIICLDYFVLPIDRYFKINQLINFTSKIVENKDGVDPEIAYFEITDQGKKNIITNNKKRLIQLLDGKKWRLRMIHEYEQGVLDGSVPYVTLLGLEDGDIKIPCEVMDFMAKTMFCGADSNLIRHSWQHNGSLEGYF